MYYKCLECGHIFEEGEERVYVQHHDLDRPTEEIFAYCPRCGGDYEEAELCERCDAAAEELYEGWCEECILEYYKYDTETCYKAGKKDLQELKINGFLATMFEPAAIEEILYKYLCDRAKNEDIDCTEYIKQDISWFAEMAKIIENK